MFYKVDVIIGIVSVPTNLRGANKELDICALPQSIIQPIFAGHLQ